MTDLLIEHDGELTLLTLNRPEKLNALDASLLEQLAAAIAAIAERDATRCAILTGAGKAFVAGADIAAMQKMGEDEAREFSKRGHAVMDGLERLRVPVIAAVNGFALGGGCELALACDFIYASERAVFGQPEVKLGVVPGFGGTQRLARRVGVARARELVYRGAMVKADEALALGIANRVLAPDALLNAAKSAAADIAAMGPLAVQAAKRLVREGEGLPLADANALEIEAFARCFGTSDEDEGMRAFLEKRQAAFTGK